MCLGRPAVIPGFHRRGAYTAIATAGFAAAAFTCALVIAGTYAEGPAREMRGAGEAASGGSKLRATVGEKNRHSPGFRQAGGKRKHDGRMRDLQAKRSTGRKLDQVPPHFQLLVIPAFSLALATSRLRDRGVRPSHTLRVTHVGAFHCFVLPGQRK